MNSFSYLTNFYSFRACNLLTLYSMILWDMQLKPFIRYISFVAQGNTFRVKSVIFCKYWYIAKYYRILMSKLIYIFKNHFITSITTEHRTLYMQKWSNKVVLKETNLCEGWRPRSRTTQEPDNNRHKLTKSYWSYNTNVNAANIILIKSNRKLDYLVAFVT